MSYILTILTCFFHDAQEEEEEEEEEEAEAEEEEEEEEHHLYRVIGPRPSSINLTIEPYNVMHYL